jgi:hypothetical protein
MAKGGVTKKTKDPNAPKRAMTGINQSSCQIQMPNFGIKHQIKIGFKCQN